MCEWRSKLDDDYRCEVPAEPGSQHCIFHAAGEKDVERFKDEFYRQILEEGPEKVRNPQYDFTGYRFPTGIAVGADIDIDEVLFPQEIEGSLIFQETIFKAGVFLCGAIVRGDVSFVSARAYRDVELVDAEISGDIHCEGALFSGDVLFLGAMIKGQGMFLETLFERKAVFSGATFESLCFANAVFEGETLFRFCKADSILLHPGKPTILVTRPKRRGVALHDPATARLFWHFAYKTFEKEGVRERADAAYYFERISRVSPERIPLKGRWWQRHNYRALLKRLLILVFQWLPDCLFLRWPIAYGASLARLGATWGVLVGCFSTLYFLLTLFGVQLFDANSAGLEWHLSFGRALYFSIITFTTLGYGDIRPAPGLGSALAATEAVLGGIMMALTVLVIGRKFMR